MLQDFWFYDFIILFNIILLLFALSEKKTEYLNFYSANEAEIITAQRP